jgi:hypothetical protein
MNLRQAYAHVDGRWYWPLKEFPGAYFDGDGCVLFQNEREFRECSFLTFDSATVTISGGLSAMPGYRKLDPPPRSL